jgi:uncharacterized membrane protein YeiH
MVSKRTEPFLATYLHNMGGKKGLPISGNFELTARCNFNCPMCYVHLQQEDIQAIGRELPLLFTDMNTEIIVCICTATVVFLLASIFKKKYVEEEHTVDRINNVLDALGLGVFASAGVGAYFAQGPLVAITMGVFSSVGGSVTRDVILGDIPPILRKHVYALASAAGSAAYYVTALLIDPANESRDVIATLACMVVIFTIRILATIFEWDLPKAIDFSKISYNQDSNDEDKTEYLMKK